MKHVTQFTFIAHNGSLGATVLADCEFEGTKKLDMPNYMPDVLKSVYEEVLMLKIADCRCSVTGIYSGQQFHHCTCQVSVQAENGESFHDSVDVFVDRQQMKPMEEE